MIGLKIKDHWLQGILNRQKTMELRSLYRNLTDQVIALGNSKTKLVEGYGYVKEIVKIKKSFYSEPSNVAIYQKTYRDYLSLYQKLYGKI